MRARGIQVFVGLVCLSALIGLSLLDWQILAQVDRSATLGLAALIGLGLLAEYLALTIDVTANKGTSSITFLPCLAALLLFGPAVASAFMLLTGAIGEFGMRRKAPLKAVFNTAQYVLSIVLAGSVFGWAGGKSLLANGEFHLQLLPFAIAGITFLGTNHLLVSSAIALSQRRSVRRVFRRLVSQSGTNVLYDWLVSPIAIGLAYLYHEIWVPGLLLSFLPLLFVRHSYLTNLALQETNRALLKALVKAIETRDPYTSGHSVRVSALSRRIGEALGLTGRKLEAIETAALLHDIGKIEAIYTEILKKPGDLSDEEREIIESHVTKGVDLLTSLGSFPKEIIEAVRHHHEREDGKGYPDGIRSSAIPLGARIIKVVDAVDAMLSDRPYRKALTLDQVREQLEMYSGTQFNEQIVRIVIRSDLLEQHAIDLAEWRPQSGQQDLDDWSSNERDRRIGSGSGEETVELSSPVG